MSVAALFSASVFAYVKRNLQAKPAGIIDSGVADIQYVLHVALNCNRTAEK